MLEKVISGFQTGADIGGIRAARRMGISTGGWMPKGFLTLEGPRPDYAALYGAQEHSSPLWPPRTHANARDSDATIWFGQGDSRGFACTEKACLGAKRPFITVATSLIKPAGVVTLIEGFGARVLNVAGNRQSSSPGIDDRVEAFLVEVFRLLGHTEEGTS